MSIRARLVLCFSFVVLTGFYVLVEWILDDVRPRYLETTEESLVDTATLLSAVIEEDLKGEKVDTEGLRRIFERVGQTQISAKIYDVVKTRVDLRVYVTDSDGIVIFDSNGGRDEGRDYSQWNDVHRTLRGEYGARATRVVPDDPSTSILHVASPLENSGELIGVVTVSKPTRSANLFIRGAQRKIVIATSMAGIAIVVLGGLTSVWLTGPIRALTQYARAIRDGKRVPLPEMGRSDLAVMGSAMEEMQSALENKEYVEHYVQTLTHELKSPVSAIQGAAELLEEDMPEDRRRQFVSNLQLEADRLTRIIDRMLLLSSLESRKALRDVGPVDLGSLAREVAASLEPARAAKQLAFEWDSSSVPPVLGERFLLRHAIANLLQNAVDFTPPGGRIYVSLSKDDRQAMLRVRDTGPGIPDFAQERVFERFYSLPRPDTGQKSSGLGLPFVKEVGDLHGGSASFSPGPGGGAEFTLRIPLKSTQA